MNNIRLFRAFSAWRVDFKLNLDEKSAMTLLTQMTSWKALVQQALDFAGQKKTQHFPPLSAANITLDYTTQRISDTALYFLQQLASECQLESMIQSLFEGEPVNSAEKKPALHTALRMPPQTALWINGNDIIPDIVATRNKMRTISERIRAGEWLGYSNKPITDIINIGIGGSQLGPQFCLHALAEQSLSSLSYHFISDMDPIAFNRITKKLNPETTLFIIASKSFTTAETLYNLKKALAWIKHPEALDRHFIAVTANPEKPQAFGINNVLPIWDWVGGRYSVCSAINLITCIAIGFELFSELLQGAHSMDEHFRNTPFSHNLPVHLALLGIWNSNFLKTHQLLVLTYGHALDYFVPYIQQLDMESNGKSIDMQYRAVNYTTGPTVWGGSGNQAQHSYYQLLCQGTHRIAVDLISIDSNEEIPVNHLCLAQKEVLFKGVYNAQKPNNAIPGNISMNHLRLQDSTPKSLGALIALYEHKVYVQSIIWHINAFDQPAVESSKLKERERSMHEFS